MRFSLLETNPHVIAVGVGNRLNLLQLHLPLVLICKYADYLAVALTFKNMASLSLIGGAVALLIIFEIFQPEHGAHFQANGAEYFEVRSKLLSEFLGKPKSIRAVVVMPENVGSHLYPAVFHFHGFGGDFRDAFDTALAMKKMMEGSPELAMIHVYMDVTHGEGYHYFVDSENNGPFEAALIAEFLPRLFAEYPISKDPRLHFLTGHSSGGWTALWLQVHNPKLFGGVWSVSPDPVDFRSFFGIDITPGSLENFYVTPDGRKRMVARSGRYGSVSLREYARAEGRLPSPDGDLGSYEFAWSPKNEDGEPMSLFDRRSGTVEPNVQKAWEKFNIERILHNNSETMVPLLKSKLHIFCGSQDDYFLNEAVEHLCETLKKHNYDAKCELIPGKGHENIYMPTVPSHPQGLKMRIYREMSEQAQNLN